MVQEGGLGLRCCSDLRQFSRTPALSQSRQHGSETFSAQVRYEARSCCSRAHANVESSHAHEEDLPGTVNLQATGTKKLDEMGLRRD
jgi:hypothetical protein